MTRIATPLIVGCLGILFVASTCFAQTYAVTVPGLATQGQIVKSYGELPLSFEVNEGVCYPPPSLSLRNRQERQDVYHNSERKR